MLKCDRIDVNKTAGWFYCIICHYWYILEINIRFLLKVCGRCFKVFLEKCSYK